MTSTPASRTFDCRPETRGRCLHAAGTSPYRTVTECSRTWL